MWFLTSKSDNRVIYVLPDKNITIGRSADGQNCNFAVPGDPSLSRKHASLYIADDNLMLWDLGSKYGTFVNHSKDKLDNNQKVILNVNDNVKFGKINCEWEVKKVSFVTCTSTLKGENIQNLKMVLDKLGGVLKGDWDDTCTHLTMPAITLTIKVVLALVQGSYIVQTDYWNRCLEAISQNAKLPEPGLFTPHIVESTLNKESVSFLPNEARTSLFAGKQVIFFSKRQLDMYKMVLEKSSATALLLSATKMTKSNLSTDNVIVIQNNMLGTTQETESQKEQINDIIKYLRSKGKRVVADAEIGLAILYCSVEKYCNPDFNFTTEVIKQPATQTTKVSDILAQETENSSQDLLKRENLKVDESLTAPNDTSVIEKANKELVTGKRKLIEDPVETGVNKKMALEIVDNFQSNNIAGKRSADSDIQTVPSKKMHVGTPADEDSFKFITNSNKITENTTNKLNFMKPIKRKIEQEADEGLFNFVRKKPATEEKNETHDSHTNQDNIEDTDRNHEIIDSTLVINNKVDVKALRGIKLSELMEQNSNMENNNKFMKVVKTEENENEDFGSTVVVVRNNLIVKREPMKEATETSMVKNFKKFKKVWPLKLQASMSKLSLSSV